MSDDLSPQQEAALDRWLQPTKPTIDDAERVRIYEAQRAGHDLPLNARRWVPCWKHPAGWHGFGSPRTLEAIKCPGCGHRITGTTFDAGPLPCDGCGHVFLVAP